MPSIRLKSYSYLLAVCCASFVVATSTSARAAGCDDGHWIQEVLADGQIIQLEDDSVWQVDGPDAVTASVWLPTDDVLVCNEGKLINVDDKETVSVRRLK
jgi:hypothetical protein